MAMNISQNATGHTVFTLGGSSFRANYNRPVLPIANDATLDNSAIYPPEANVFDFKNSTSIRIVLINPLTLAHPMHLHGHNVWILAEGMGTWDGKVVNGNNPMRRDTFIINAGTPDLPAYTVIEWDADNPGTWPFHCHVSAHASLGFVSIILVCVLFLIFLADFSSLIVNRSALILFLTGGYLVLSTISAKVGKHGLEPILSTPSIRVCDELFFYGFGRSNRSVQ